YAATPDVTGDVHLASTTAWISAGDTRLAETSKAIAYLGAWSTATYASYSGGQVKYATRSGASATVVFEGVGSAWVGPVGPTRGTARVYIDGHAVASVDLRRSTFQARKIVFARALAAGTHTLKIVVTSSGRPV